MENMQGVPVFIPEEVLQQQKERRRFNRVGLAFFAWMSIAFAVQIAVSVILAIIDFTIPSWFSIVFTIVSLYGIAAPLSYLILRTTPADPPKRQRLNVKGIFFFLFIALFFTLAGQIIGLVINSVLGAVTGSQQGGEIGDALMSGDLWLSILYSCLVAPILEELFFRKFLIDRLRGAGDWIVIIISGLMFGLFHGNIEQFCYAALLGGLFAYVYLHTGKIWYCMLFHGILNWIGGGIPMLVMIFGDALGGVLAQDAITMFENVFTLLLFGVRVILAIAGMIILIVFFRGLKKQIRPGTLSFGKVSGAAFGNVGMILFLVVALAEVGLNVLMNMLPS